MRTLKKIKFQKCLKDLKSNNGGEGGIRTHERVAPSLVFKTSAFNRSATSPYYITKNNLTFVVKMSLYNIINYTKKFFV